MNSPSRHIRSGARLAILLELKREGMLQDLTLQQIADALGDGRNRSTIMRNLRDLQLVESEIERVRDRLNKSILLEGKEKPPG